MPISSRRDASARRRPLTYVTVTLAAVAVAVLCVFALNKGDLQANGATYNPPKLPTGAGGTTSSPTTSASPSPTVSPAPPPSASPTATSDPRPLAVFIGDSYTAGDGASNAAHAFPALVGESEGWRVDIVSCEGAGYATVGACGKSFPDLVAEAVAARPSIVVVSGGRNDMGAFGHVADAAQKTFSQLRTALRTAKLYAISPVWDSRWATAPLGQIQKDVSTAASANGATYLDVDEPLRGHPEWIASDGVSPTDRGHAELAKAIEHALG